MEVSAIAKIYARQVQKGNKSIDEVPESIKDQVLFILGEK